MATASPQAKVDHRPLQVVALAVPKLTLKRLGLADLITQLEGDAADILPTLEQGKYDFPIYG